MHPVPKERFDICYDVATSAKNPPTKKKACRTKRLAIVVIATLFSAIVISGSLCGYAALAFEIHHWTLEGDAISMNSSQVEEILQNIAALQTQIQQFFDVLGRPGQYPTFPASSCAALPPSSPSGYYWVRASNGSAVRVYCDMTFTCGNITGGWMRVNWTWQTAVTSVPVVSWNAMTPTYAHVWETWIILVVLRHYFQLKLLIPEVCGRIIAYQFGSTDAFSSTTPHIDSVYVQMVLVSLMEAHDGTSGHLLRHVMKLLRIVRAPANQFQLQLLPHL